MVNFYLTFLSDPPDKKNGTIASDGSYSGQLLSYNGAYNNKIKTLWDKPFVINFDYKYVSGGASDWRHIFSYGTHINSYGTDDAWWALTAPGAGFRTAGVNSGLSDDQKFHNIKLVYDGAYHKIYIDNVLKETKNINDMRSNINSRTTAFYFSGGGHYSELQCEVKNFYITRDAASFSGNTFVLDSNIVKKITYNNSKVSQIIYNGTPLWLTQ